MWVALPRVRGVEGVAAPAIEADEVGEGTEFPNPKGFSPDEFAGAVDAAAGAAGAAGAVLDWVVARGSVARGFNG